jgi:hypothetical protein
VFLRSPDSLCRWRPPSLSLEDHKFSACGSSSSDSPAPVYTWLVLIHFSLSPIYRPFLHYCHECLAETRDTVLPLVAIIRLIYEHNSLASRGECCLSPPFVTTFETSTCYVLLYDVLFYRMRHFCSVICVAITYPKNVMSSELLITYPKNVITYPKNVIGFLLCDYLPKKCSVVYRQQ